MSEVPGGGQRDFLAEAATLAAQLDAGQWGEFEFQDAEVAQDLVAPQHWQFGAESMLASQGAVVMRDLPTAEGTQAMCALYQPPVVKNDPPLMLGQPQVPSLYTPPILVDGIPVVDQLPQPRPLQTQPQPQPQPNLLQVPPAQPQPVFPAEQPLAARQSPAKASSTGARTGLAGPADDELEDSNLASSSGSDEAWEPSQDEHISPRLRRLPEQGTKARSRERGKSTQQRRRKQQQKGKQDDQRKWASLTQELRAVQAEKQSLEAHASMLEKALMRLSVEGAKQKPSEPVFIPALGWKSFDPKGSIVLSVVFDQPRKLTCEQVIRISVRDHCQLWREFVVRIGECLKHAKEGPDPTCPHTTKLKALLDERHGYLAFVAANNPLAVHRLTQCKVTDPPVYDAEPAPPQLYSNILRKIKLSEGQREALVDARNKYLVGLGYHSAALARAQHTVMRLDPAPHESLRNSSYLGWVQVSRALQEAMDEIHVCHVTLMFAIYGGPHALSPFQAGTMLVESFPYLPDMIQLVKELAAEVGAPTSEELLRVGAVKYQERNGFSEIKYCAAQPYIPVVEKISDLIQSTSLKQESVL